MSNFVQALKAVKFLLLFVYLISFTQTLIAAGISPEWQYSVRPHDNLINLSKKYLINPDDWHMLQKLNQIKNPYRMLVGSVLRVPLTLVKQVPAAAEVLIISGQSGILNSDNSLQAVTVGQQLGSGTTLATRDNSKLSIKFADGSILKMESNSELKLDALSLYSGGGMVDTKLRLQQGRLEAQANPKHMQGNTMQISTPTAVAAVRGTQFRVATDGETIRQETLDGNVTLTAASEEVSVKKGYGSLSEAGRPPLPPVALLPAPTVTGLPAKFDKLPVSFAIPAQTAAVVWVGKISSDAQFNRILVEKSSNNNDLVFSNLPDGDYYLSVRGADKQGLEGYDATHPFVVKARPFAPQATTPSQNEVIREAQPAFKWASAAQANDYQLDVATDVEFKQIVDTKRTASNTIKLDKDLQPGQYFWRLASISKDQTGKDDQGPYAAASAFTYKPKPSAPDISQLKVSVVENRVFVTTISPPQGLTYEVVLNNARNHQYKVWHETELMAEFNFLLREYGKQTLLLHYVDSDGVAGADAIYEFNAPPF